MFKESGVFRYEKDGVTYEERVISMTRQAGLVVVITLNNNVVSEYVYIPEAHCWKTPDERSEEGIYKNVPFKVLYCNFETAYYTDDSLGDD